MSDEMLNKLAGCTAMLDYIPPREWQEGCI